MYVDEMLARSAVEVAVGLAEGDVASGGDLVSSAWDGRDVSVVDRPVEGSYAASYGEGELGIVAAIAEDIGYDLGADGERRDRSLDGDGLLAGATPLTVAYDDSVDTGGEVGLYAGVVDNALTCARPSVGVVA